MNMLKPTGYRQSSNVICCADATVVSRELTNKYSGVKKNYRHLATVQLLFNMTV